MSHLKDVAAADPAAPDAMFGQGVLDVVAVFRALRDIGFPRDADNALARVREQPGRAVRRRRRRAGLCRASSSGVIATSCSSTGMTCSRRTPGFGEVAALRDADELVALEGVFPGSCGRRPAGRTTGRPPWRS